MVIQTICLHYLCHHWVVRHSKNFHSCKCTMSDSCTMSMQTPTVWSNEGHNFQTVHSASWEPQYASASPILGWNLLNKGHCAMRISCRMIVQETLSPISYTWDTDFTRLAIQQRKIFHLFSGTCRLIQPQQTSFFLKCVLFETSDSSRP